jgi:hypothetical protein
MRNSRACGVTLFILLAGGGCKAPADRGTPADSTATSTVPAKARLSLSAMPMLPKVRAHLDEMDSHPAMMRDSMPSHETEMKDLVEAMRADMLAAGMHSDSAYESLADSVVQGAGALNAARGPQFERLVKQHVDQVRRLAAVYESKVAAM